MLVRIETSKSPETKTNRLYVTIFSLLIGNILPNTRIKMCYRTNVLKTGKKIKQLMHKNNAHDTTSIESNSSYICIFNYNQKAEICKQ